MENMKASPMLTNMFLILFTCKILKLGDVGDWRWWVITTPLWIPLAIMIVAMILRAIFKALKDGE